jgi:hypothetical protein
MAAASGIDPWAAAFGAVATVAKPVPAGPNYATGGTVGTTFDDSGFTVIFGDGNDMTTTRTQQQPAIGATVAAAAGSLGQYAPYIVGAMVLVMVMKKRRQA